MVLIYHACLVNLSEKDVIVPIGNAITQNTL